MLPPVSRVLPLLCLALGLNLFGCVEPEEEGGDSAPIVAGVQPCLMTETEQGYTGQRIFFSYSFLDADCDLEDGSFTLAVDGLVVEVGGLGNNTCSVTGHTLYSAELEPGDELTYQVWVRDAVGHVGGSPEATWVVPDQDDCPDLCPGNNG